MTDIAPLIKRSLVDQALEQLRLRIAQGVWAVGERLPTEPELSAELGISRNTVREAMRVLAFSGLIEIRQGDGSYLRSMTDPLGAMRALSHCTLAQAQETRQILEVEAIGLAAQRRTEQDLQGCIKPCAPAPRCITVTWRPISTPTWCSTPVWWMPPTTRR